MTRAGSLMSFLVGAAGVAAALISAAPAGARQLPDPNTVFSGGNYEPGTTTDDWFYDSYLGAGTGASGDDLWPDAGDWLEYQAYDALYDENDATDDWYVDSYAGPPSADATDR